MAMNSDKPKFSKYSNMVDSSLSRILSYSKPQKKIVLWRLLFHSEFIFSYMAMILLRIFDILFGNLIPYLTDLYLGKLSQFSPNDPDQSWVYSHCLFIIALLYIQCYIGEWIGAHNYSFFLRLKLWLNYLLLDKSLRIKVLTTQKDGQSSPNLINVVTQDVHRLECGLRSFIDTIAILVELFLGVFYLYNQISKLNFSFLSLFWLIAILMIVNISIVGISQIFSLKGQWARDKRVWLLQEVFQGIRSIKMLSWEDVFERRISDVRKEEFRNISVIRVIDAFFNSMIRSIGFLIMLILSFWLEGRDIKLDMYSALLMINKLVYPITAFPWSIGSAIGMIFPYLRLQKHFNAKEVQVDGMKKLLNPMNMLEIKNLEFVWSEEGQCSLKVPEFSVQKGELTMICGANGSGKTTLLRLILGELSPKKGLISLERENVAYVSQDTWLIDGGFRENIILDSDFEADKYTECLNSCCLLSEISDKDKGFRIGLNGNKLSGGQRQRVSLCRALYQDKELYLLDDAFSSLDEKVADEIFREYVIKGLISKGKTVVFITTQEKYLGFAHKTLELKEGNLFFFETKNGQSSDMLKVPAKREFQEKNMISSSEGSHSIPKALDIVQPFAWNGINRYLKALGRKTFILILLIALIQQATKHYSEIFFNNILTSSQSQTKNENSSSLAVVYMILTIARGLVYCFGVLKVAQLFFKEMMKSMLNANMEFYEKYQPGELINYLTMDIDSIDCGLPEDVNGWASIMINIAGIFVVISYEFPVLIALCWIIATKAYKYYQTHSKTNKIQKQTMREKDSCFLNEILELFQGLIIIRAFRKQTYFLKKAIKSLKDVLVENSKDYLAHRSLVLQTSMLTLSASATILLFSLLYFSLEGNPYDPKVLGVALSYSLMLSKHLLDAICSTINLESQLISLQRLTSLEKISLKPLAYNDDKDPIVVKSENNDSSLISFEGVYLKYGESPSYSLENISLQIRKGEKVAFCGRTGSGKSSIFSLILKLYPYQSGVITYSGKPLPKWQTKELRETMAMIPQNGFLFKGSLKDNLDPSNKFTPKEIMSFMKEYEIDDVFADKSLEFMIEKEGSNLSNGEKQMVNFLQNILADKELILLDEATSNLDEKLDKRIMSLLRKICKDKTLLLITHRLENLDFFDNIYILEGGRIKESGSLLELKGNQKSIFHDLKTKLV